MHRTMTCLAVLALAALLPACTAYPGLAAGSTPPLGSGPPPGGVEVTEAVHPNGVPVRRDLAPPGGATPTAETSSTVAYRAVLAHSGIHMAIPFTGNADQDFVGNMVPFHQAAIDLAEVELKYGHNPEVRRIARRIIVQDEHENDEMNAWLLSHPVRQQR
jgi:hypothetical protein